MRIKTKTTYDNYNTATECNYDEEGRIILKRQFNRFNLIDQTSYEYDENNIIHEKTDRNEIYSTVDSHGNIIHEKIVSINDGSVEEKSYHYDYDNHGNITHYEDSNGEEVYYHYKYDDNGNMIKKLSTDGSGPQSYKYDENGRLIYHTFPYYNGIEIDEAYNEYEYDEHGNCISIESGSCWQGEKSSKDDKTLYEYDEYGNCILEKTEKEDITGLMYCSYIVKHDYEYYDD